MKICLVAFYSPYQDNHLARLSDLYSIFEPLAEEIFIITRDIPQGTFPGKKVHIINIKHFSISRFILVKAAKQLLLQLSISWHLLRVSSSVDLIFWGINTGILVLPVAVARLMGKRTILFVGGRFSDAMELIHSNKLLTYTCKMLEDKCLSCAGTIVANSTLLLKQPWLAKYKDKTYPLACPTRFMDTEVYRISKPLRQRANLVGFVGQLSEEKGAVEFVKAISLVLGKRSNLEFVVIGEGYQGDEIKAIVKENGLLGKIELVEWVPHNKLPNYLNKMRLVVLPSFTEGLPTVALEAMACGTPVLATPVGGVPELIKDGETGFILADNSPETIAQGIIRALRYSNLDDIVSNAHSLIEKEYTYEVVAEKWFNLILRGISNVLST